MQLITLRISKNLDNISLQELVNILKIQKLELPNINYLKNNNNT